MIRKTLISAAILFGAANAAVAAEPSQCMAMSDWQFQITPAEVIAIRDDAAPNNVILRGGKLFVQNAWVPLNAADTQRVNQLETQLRALEPAIQDENAALGRTQAGMFGAMGGGNIDTYGWQQQMAADRTARRFRIGPMGAWQTKGSEQFAARMGERMLSMMGPVLEAMRGGIRNDPAAAERMSKVFEGMPIPDVSGQMTSRLCPQYRSLNELDNALTYRYSGEPLELLRILEPQFR